MEVVEHAVEIVWILVKKVELERDWRCDVECVLASRNL